MHCLICIISWIATILFYSSTSSAIQSLLYDTLLKDILIGCVKIWKHAVMNYFYFLFTYVKVKPFRRTFIFFSIKLIFPSKHIDSNVILNTRSTWFTSGLKIEISRKCNPPRLSFPSTCLQQQSGIALEYIFLEASILI